MEEEKDLIKESDEKKDHPQQSSDYEFIKEQIKDRPVNKKKLIKKMLFTAGMAVLFSLIACMSFLLLEPLLEEVINPEESTELSQVTLPEIVEEDEESVTIDPVIVETPIEDMILTDDSMANGEQNPSVDGSVSGNGSGHNTEASESANVVVSVPQELELSDYQLLYRKLYALSTEVSKSIVTVTGITSDLDWLNETYLSTKQTTGLILADNTHELLILADRKNIENAERIRVTFVDGNSADATIKQLDETTGLAVLTVNLADVSAETKETITVATLGSSYATSVLGSAVIAIGNPLGSGRSICYGAITSMDRTVSLMDANYQLLTTDIYGSKNANGVLINIRGQIIGIITQDYNSEDMQNLIYAYGISSIRLLMQNLSNGVERIHLGLYIAEVSQEAAQEAGLPNGVYVTDVVMNTPAMNYGIAKGDVITAIGGRSISSVNDYSQAIAELAAGDTVRITYARQSSGTYKSMSVQIELDSDM